MAKDDDIFMDLDPPEPKRPGFFQSTFIKIMSVLISLAITGAVGYFFASVKSGLDEIKAVKDRVTKVEIVQASDLANRITELKDAIKEHSTSLGSVDGELKKLDITVARLEERVGSLERHR
jgi:hypothetical protein